MARISGQFSRTDNRIETYFLLLFVAIEIPIPFHNCFHLFRLVANAFGLRSRLSREKCHILCGSNARARLSALYCSHIALLFPLRALLALARSTAVRARASARTVSTAAQVMAKLGLSSAYDERRENLQEKSTSLSSRRLHTSSNSRNYQLF
jgi:hypothetical protein